MIACVILLLVALVGHLLFSAWPGALVGASVFMILLGGAWGYEVIDGSIAHLKKSITFIFSMFVFWGTPYFFFLLDAVNYIRGNAYYFPQLRLLVPLVSGLVFVILYALVCKAINKHHTFMGIDRVVMIVFCVFSTMLFSSFEALYFYMFYAGQQGKFFGVLICIVYSFHMLVVRVRKSHWPLMRFCWLDILAVLFYCIVFSTPFLIVLAFGFLVTFFECSGKYEMKVKGMLFWHGVLIVLPVLAFYYHSDEIWREAFAFRENSLMSLSFYEVFALLYAVATVLREFGNFRGKSETVAFETKRKSPEVNASFVR